MHLQTIVTASLLLLTLAACGKSAPSPPDEQGPNPTLETVAGESSVSPPATPTPASAERTSPLGEPATSPLETPSSATEKAVADAKEHLARELSIAPDGIEAVAIEPVEWPDASLGCPQPGKAYAQVVTPGYRIVLEVDGKQYELHTDRTAGSIRICERQLERGPAAAVAYLADQLEVPAEEVEVLSVESYEWPDASLGCPEPGKSYAQVITPGYRVILSARGEEYEVRTDKEGKLIALCDQTP